MMLKPVQVEHALLCERADQCSERLVKCQELVVPCVKVLNFSAVHGGSSVGVYLVGTFQPNRELSPRLYRGGDHA